MVWKGDSSCMAGEWGKSIAAVLVKPNILVYTCYTTKAKHPVRGRSFFYYCSSSCLLLLSTSPPPPVPLPPNYPHVNLSLTTPLYTPLPWDLHGWWI